jgi:pSer/pThr/pTyr-binding forkhead associated (FHA) protein
MIHLEVAGRRIPVPTEPLVIGSAADAGVHVEGPGILPRHAVVTAIPAGGAAIRASDAGAEVLVNGVRLGADPTPLLHGDKITVPGHEFRITDERRVGETSMMAAFSASEGAPTPLSATSVPTSGPTLNGRLVCLTDGREYLIADQGLVFGRDASSDVVVDSDQVSRRHASIQLTGVGYVVTDESVNGTLVNGQRLTSPRVLARADILRIGSDEFRFYADVKPVEQAPTTPPPAVGARQRLNDTLHGIPMAPPPSMSLPGLNDTLHGFPATPAPGSVPAILPLASLLIRSGALKGRRMHVRAAQATIGRADSCDIVLPESSVSTMHAKLQRREGVWVISDLGSTNGTLVDGERVQDEVPLSPGASIKLGEVMALFEPVDSATDAGAAAPSAPRTESMVRPRIADGVEAPKRKVSVVAIVVFLVLLAAAAALVFLR